MAFWIVVGFAVVGTLSWWVRGDLEMMHDWEREVQDARDKAAVDPERRVGWDAR